ncbi:MULTISPECIES: LysR family transcriptional regulator [Achromobacter]|jgi:DNA-binding transcriptional LysR family regulator|uniref:LysR family transcriptional regulator n=1 Tax=Alcaligenes xylosoxydans xylosoxydans TaxID=85698 RepID=UPI0005DA494C|nr:LysR family transcriptional regulator [Achromobacter xylosoxidans]MBK1977439.1 LysR family transcriptional regulator [Achromobacter xylosoxidans]MCH4571578.1 LysR substrate-binding domain-containing protein [Achromobacter xylosoxidans]MCM2572685.1 LysR substrate-binding domain-containing protein [Achromobacter xylosoxidans]MCZ8387986.1 LysR substrate-binding domain-containing protein [Achromobacter xylosoxidans]MDD7989949.1 LysR substrate-binding domain-containing protein [Achromobacter xyl
MRNLDLDALQIFKAVADHGGVARAAVHLNRVQSNVSTRLKQLEATLEAPLFRRQNRRLVLSEQGRVLLSYADRLLRLSAEAQAAVRDGAPQGLLRIGTMESTAAARLPPILAAYHAAWPQVRIELVTGTSGALAAKVRNYEIEAAFVAQPFEAQGLAQQPAFDEELALISPLAWPEIHGPKDVGDRSVIAFAAGCSYRRILEAWFGQEGVAPDKVMEFASYHAIVACVAAGSGVAIVPRSVLALLGAEPSLRVTPLSGKHGRAQTRLVWRADDETPALQALQQLLAQRRQ